MRLMGLWHLSLARTPLLSILPGTLLRGRKALALVVVMMIVMRRRRGKAVSSSLHCEFRHRCDDPIPLRLLLTAGLRPRDRQARLRHPVQHRPD